MTDTALAIVILAAGQGTRMKSRTPKLLHTLAGVPIISHVLATARELGAAHVLTNDLTHAYIDENMGTS